MKIGLVSPYALNYGGVQEHIRALYRNFTDDGHEVKIIAPRLGRQSPQKDVIYLGRGFYVESSTGTGAYLTLGFHYGPVVEEILRREKFDILHFHEPVVPTISWFLLAYSTSCNIITFHRGQKFSQEEGALYALFNPLLPLLTKKVSGRIAVSESAKELANKFFPGQYRVIPNGVDLATFRPKGPQISALQDGKINILFVGRIEGRKGLIYLLRAFSNLQDDRFRLIVVGDGPLRKTCEDFAHKKGLYNVVFEGEVPPSKLPLYYRSADIFCSPALYGESFGIVLLEALASGLPVVAFANQGYRELLVDYPAPQLLPQPKDVRGLTKALNILAKDQRLRANLGLWGGEKVKRYSWKKVSKEVFRFYQKTFEQKEAKMGTLDVTPEITFLPRLVKNFIARSFVWPS